MAEEVSSLGTKWTLNCGMGKAMRAHREAGLARDETPELRREVHEGGHEQEHERDPLRVADPVLVLLTRVAFRRQVLVLRVPVVEARHPACLLSVLNLPTRMYVSSVANAQRVALLEMHGYVWKELQNDCSPVPE